MAMHGKNNKQTRRISRRMDFLRHGEKLKLHKKVLYKGGLKLSYIESKNVREYGFIP